MTFKDIRKIIAEKNKALERESKFYDPSHYWGGKKVVSLDQWLKIKSNSGLKAALQYFPNDFPRSGFTFILYCIEDKTLEQEAEQWRSDFVKLVEYRKNPELETTYQRRSLHDWRQSRVMKLRSRLSVARPTVFIALSDVSQHCLVF